MKPPTWAYTAMVMVNVFYCGYECRGPTRPLHLFVFTVSAVLLWWRRSVRIKLGGNE